MPTETWVRTQARAVGAAEAANGVAILLFSGDFDRVQAALMIATAAAACGQPVTICFTFWGLTALKQKSTYRGKSFLQRMVAAMLPGSIHRLGTSRLNMMGAGPLVFQSLMKRKGVPRPAELLALAQQMGVRLVACTTSMELMGISADELLPGVESAGAASFLGEATRSRVQLVF